MKNNTPGPTKEIVTNTINNIGSSNIGELLKKLQPLITLASNMLNTIMPYFITVYTYLKNAYNILPMDILQALLGLSLCFFGGIYALTISACETFYMTGWKTFYSSFMYLRVEFQKLWKQSLDDDKNMNSADAGDLFTRKLSFFFSRCSDPQKIIDMIGALIQSIMGVMAVVKFKFAKIFALGVSIGENLRKPATHFLVPIASTALPKEFHKWIAPGINVICKCVAVILAWFLHRIVASVQTGIRGGLIFSRKILGYCNKKGYLSFKENESNLDEILGWSVAALGVYFQLTSYFYVPFPLNLILFPVNIVENYLQWIVSS